MEEERGFVTAFALLLGGFAIWAVQFLVVYATTSLACAGTLGTAATPVAALPLHQVVILGATTLALAGCAFVAVWARRGAAAVPRRPGQDRPGLSGGFTFVRTVGMWVSGLAALAVLWTALPGMLMSACT